MNIILKNEIVRKLRAASNDRIERCVVATLSELDVNCLETDEYMEIESENFQRDRVLIPKQVSISLGTYCKRKGKVPMIIHNHCNQKETVAEFSVIDSAFIDKYILFLRKIGYVGVCIFGIYCDDYILFSIWNVLTGELKQRCIIDEHEDILPYVFVGENKGLVWLPEYGEIKKTTREHAEILDSYISRYAQLPNDEKMQLNAYLNREFSKKAKVSVIQPIELTETHEIQKLEVIVSTQCNLSCRYCYAKGGTYGKKSEVMDEDDAISYVNALLGDRIKVVNNVVFFGGEPTINPRTIRALCREFTERAKNNKLEKCPIFSIVSNGTMMTKEMIEIIREYGIRVTLSLDGPKKINDILRIGKGIDSVFELVDRAVSDLKTAGIQIELIEATYTSEHEKMGFSRTDVQEYLKKSLNVKNVMIADCEGSTPNQELICSSKSQQVYCNRNDILRIKSICKRKEVTERTCGVGYSSITMMPNGDLYPCHFFVEYEQFCLAHFYNERYVYDDYAKAMGFLRQASPFRNKECSNCFAKFTCSMCPAGFLIHGMCDCNRIKEAQKKYLLSV